MADERLTPKQQRFVEEWLVDCNATQAAIRAGYSAKTARQTAAENLSKPVIAAALSSAIAARRARTEVTADRVVLELARVAFSDARALYRPDGTLKAPCEWDDDVAAAVSGVETDESVLEADGRTTLTTRTHKVKRWDKLNALGKLMPHVGLKDEPPPAPGVSVTVIGGIDLAAVVGARPGLHADRIGRLSDGNGNGNGQH